MREEVKSLVEDLERGFDGNPEESARELARMDDLCREAADLIRSQSARIDYMDRDPFNVLNRINVNDHIEKKKVTNKKTGKETYLSYLSWAWAWQMLMELYPMSYTSINRSPEGLPYWSDGRTCWVDVSVTIVCDSGFCEHPLERTRSEIFPIMGGYSNQSISASAVTSFDVNTALQRAWTKCIARHGLGFYIYAGEDLPQEEAEAKKAETATEEQLQKVSELYTPEEIAKMLKRLKKSNPVELSKEEAQKMIDKRDLSLVNQKVDSF